MKNYKQVAPGFMEQIESVPELVGARFRHQVEAKCNGEDCYVCEVFSSRIYAATRKKKRPTAKAAGRAGATRPDKHEDVITNQQGDVSTETLDTRKEYNTDFDATDTNAVIVVTITIERKQHKAVE